MRKIFLILLILSSLFGASQPVVNRANAGQTVQDARWMGQLNAFMPRYADTTQANLSKGIDSAGAIIYTYDANVLWLRQSSPKKWVRVASGSSAVNIYTSDGTQTDASRTYNGNGGNLTFTNFDRLAFSSFNDLIISPLDSGLPTDSLLTWDGNTGAVRKIQPGIFSGSCAPTIFKLNDSTLIVSQCPSGKIDTVTIHSGTSSTVINNYYFSNDTTMQVCYNVTPLCVTYHNANPALPDSTVCTPQTVCETVVVPGVTSQYIFQNGLTQTAQRIIEQGDKFNHATRISGQNLYDFRYDSLNFSVRGVYASGQPLQTILGPGMGFSPRKGAFVAGYWNLHSNVGLIDSTDIGPFTQNIGVNNQVTGNYSGSFGGISNSITGFVSVNAGGNDNTIAGNRSGTFSSQSSTINGNSYNSVIIGGYGGINYSQYGLLHGLYTQQYTRGGTVVGQYNDTVYSRLRGVTNGNYAIYDPNGQALVVGNGTGLGAARSNAITVYNDRGKTIIGGSALDSASQLKLMATNLAFKVNSGTTAQMNSVLVPYDGLLYWNSDSLALCEYTNSAWRKVDRIGSTLNNVGTGYPLAIAGTNNVKKLSSTDGITLDSTSLSNTIIIGYNGSAGIDSTAFYYLSQLNDTTTLFHRRDGTSDTLVVGIRGGGSSGGGGGTITLAAIGSSPNANGATLSGSVLNLQPANGTFGGVISTAAQTMGAGVKTFVKDIKVYNNIQIGRGTGEVNTNLVFGSDALTSNTTGFQNWVSGYFSGNANTTGSQNIFQGYFAGFSNVSGGNNIFIGANSGKFNQTGNSNIFIGTGAGQASVDDGFSIAIGTGVASVNPSMFRNTMVGYAAGALTNQDAYDLALYGFNAGTNLTSGQKVTAIGSAALENTTTGYQLTAVGQDAGLHNVDGYWNIYLGWLAGSLNVHGHSNVSLGTSSARSVSSGDSSVFIGTGAGYDASQAAVVSNDIAIGTGVYTTGSNQVKIGNANNTSIYLRGTLYWNDDPGTAGYVLTSQGIGLPAIWAAGGGGGGGSVISFTFTDGNGFDGTVSTPTTTPTLSLTTDITSGRVVYATTSGAIKGVAGFTFDDVSALTLGVSGTSRGKTIYSNLTSGAVTVQAPATGTWTWTIPTDDGTVGQYLQTDGNGVTSWQTISGSGSVTSVDASGGTTGMTFSGGPITISGVLTMAGTLITTNGGTGLASYTQGDLLYFNSGTALSKLAKSTTANQFLSNGGTSNNPAWASITASMIGSGAALTKVDGANVTLTLGGSPTTSLLSATSLTLGWTGLLAVQKGGTNLGGYSTGDLLYASATNVLSSLPIGAPNYVLTSSGGIPVWAAIGGGGPVTTPISSLLSGVANNSIDSRGYQQTWQWDSLYNIGLSVRANSTHANATGSSLFEVLLSGANSANDVISAAGYFSNAHTGGGTTVNAAVWATASGGTYNLGIESLGNIGIYNTTPTDLLELGSAFYTKTGSIGFNGLTSGKVTMTVSAAAGTWTMKLPTSAGSPGYFLQTDGTGITTWAAATGGVTSITATDGNGFDLTVTNPTTTPDISVTTTVADTRIVYSSNGAVTGAAGLVFDGTSLVTIGVSGSSLGQLRLTGNTGGVLTIRPGSSFTNFTLQLPSNAGAAGQFLRTDGFGVTTWVSGNSGTVTSVDVSGGTTGLTTSGGPVTTSGTITLAGVLITSNGGTGLFSYSQGDLTYYNSGTAFSKLTKSTTANQFLSNGGTNNNPSWATITAAMIGSPAALTKTDDTNITITLGGSPTTSLLTATSLTLGWSGTLAATRGGTGFGSYTVGDLIYASTTTAFSKLGIGSTGQVLKVVGGVPAWSSASAGTVTDFIFTDANGFDGTVSTSTTTPTLSLTTTVTSTQLVYSSSGAIAGVSGVTSDGTNVTAGSGNLRATRPRITTSIDDISGNKIIGLSTTTTPVNFVSISNGDAGSAPTITVLGTDTNIPLDFSFKGNSRYGFYGTTTAPANLTLYEQSTNGSDRVTITALAAISSSWTLTLPGDDGITGQVLSTDGNGITSWVSAATGSVTSIAAGAGMNFSTITGSGSIVMGTPSSITLASTNSASGTTHSHALALGGTSSQVLLGNNTLGTYFTGTVTSVSGTTNRITVATGTTTPVIDISSSYVGQSSITTLGTITTGVWNGTAVVTTYGGTGLTSWTQGDLPYYTSGTALTKLAKSTSANYYLKNSGTSNAPQWQPILYSDISSGSYSDGGLVFFESAVPAQDNSQLFWDNSGNLFGIGTNTPDYKLDLRDNSAGYATGIENANTSGSGLYVAVNSNSGALIANFAGTLSRFAVQANGVIQITGDPGTAGQALLSGGSASSAVWGDVVTPTGVQTLTNKAITPRIGSNTSSSTPTPNASFHDQYNVTALVTGATFQAPSGSAVNGQRLIIRIHSAGVQSLAWDAVYRGGITWPLPSATTAGGTMYLEFVYNSEEGFWDLLSFSNIASA